MFSERSDLHHEHDPLDHALAARRARGDVLDLSVRPDRDATAFARALFLLCDPGDELLVPEPSLSPIASAAQLAGVTLVPYPMRYHARWSLDAGSLWDAITERTRAILAVTPNHATGAFLGADELDALDALGLPLIVDARLAAYRLEGEPPTPPTANVLRLWLDESALTVTGQHRDEALARLTAMDAVFGVPPSPQRSSDVRPALDALRETLRGSALELPPIDAGWHAPLRLPTGQSEMEWALALLERGVLVTPGSKRGFPDEEAWLVLDLRAEPADLQRAADALLQLARRAR